MNAAWIVEVLDRHHHVAQRVRVTQWPAVVGRGYDCDVMVDDPHVAARHVELQVDEHGVCTARDMGTLNGVRRAVGKVNTANPAAPKDGVAAPLTLQPGELIEIGRTRLRLCAPGMAVAPERAMDHRLHLPGWAAWVLPALALAMLAFQSWFASVDEFKPLALLTGVVLALLATVAWAGLWALVTRLLHGAAQYALHLAWASAALLVVLVVPWVVDSVAFAFDWPWLSTSLRLLAVALGAVVLMGHLTITFGKATRRTWAAVLTLAAITIGIPVAESWQSHHRLWPNTFMTTVRPLAWRLSGDSSLDAFYDRARAQQLQVDALRRKDGEGADE